jgi:hypothetical protein
LKRDHRLSERTEELDHPLQSEVLAGVRFDSRDVPPVRPEPSFSAGNVAGRGLVRSLHEGMEQDEHAAVIRYRPGASGTLPGGHRDGPAGPVEAMAS